MSISDRLLRCIAVYYIFIYILISCPSFPSCLPIAMDGDKLHIVMLPWLAFGHLIPFLELSKYLAGKDHRISFLSTPRNIARLPSLPSDVAPLIDLVPLPRTHVEELPEDVEATADLPHEALRPYLSLLLDGLEEHLASFLEAAAAADSSRPPPDWIVHDYAFYWAPGVAARFGVPCAFLDLFSAAVSSFLGPPASLMGSGDRPGGYTAPPQWMPFPSTVAFRPRELREFASRPSLPADSPPHRVSETYRVGCSIKKSDVVAVRTCREFEPEYLGLLGELCRPTPVVPVGFFPPLLDGDEEIAGATPTTIFDWLGEQAPASVVYAAFGTEARLSSEQAHEIAAGLDLSGFPFLWVLRRPPPGIVTGEGGGVERRGRGIVCTGWVPQSRVLSHPSVGGFLTHCGWNSVVEGLRCGLPLALLPMVFDQALNARLLVEKTAGVEVPRGSTSEDDDNAFTGAAVADTLRLVMAGEGLRARARELMGVFGDVELQDQYVSAFVEYLREHRRRPAGAVPAEGGRVPAGQIVT